MGRGEVSMICCFKGLGRGGMYVVEVGDLVHDFVVAPCDV